MSSSLDEAQNGGGGGMEDCGNNVTTNLVLIPVPLSWINELKPSRLTQDQSETNKPARRVIYQRHKCIKCYVFR